MDWYTASLSKYPAQCKQPKSRSCLPFGGCRTRSRIMDLLFKWKQLVYRTATFEGPKSLQRTRSESRQLFKEKCWQQKQSIRASVNLHKSLTWHPKTMYELTTSTTERLANLRFNHFLKAQQSSQPLSTHLDIAVCSDMPTKIMEDTTLAS